MRDAIVPFRLSQGALSAGYDSPDYYFYVTFGTMPTLYAGIHLLSHDKPGYVFYSRSKTFDPAEFPARAEVTTAADRTADATQAEMEAMAREMKRRILEINRCRPDGRLRPLCGRPALPDRLRLVRGAGDRLGTGQGEHALPTVREPTITFTTISATRRRPSRTGRAMPRRSRRWTGITADVIPRPVRCPSSKAIRGLITFLPAPITGWWCRTVRCWKVPVRSSPKSSGRWRSKASSLTRCFPALPESSRKRFYDMAGFDYDNFAALFDASPRKTYTSARAMPTMPRPLAAAIM